MYHAKNAVLLLSHFLNDLVINRYKKLYEDLDPLKYETVLLLNMDISHSNDVPAYVNLFTADTYSISCLHYSPLESTLLPGSCHFPLMSFFLKEPTFKYYWFVEYDVEFTGKWSVMMEDFDTNLCDYDFLSCHVEEYNTQKNKEWIWWHRGNNLNFPLAECMKSFNPICRYSREALAYIDLYQKRGFTAHSEVLIPTCLHHAGYQIGDLGGTGDFVPHGYKNKYYISESGCINGGTVRYRPIYNKEQIKNKGLFNCLFHPSKND